MLPDAADSPQNSSQSLPQGATEESSQAEQNFHYDLQKEILMGRQFSLADVIGKEAGSFMKGGSPIPRLMQAITEINHFIDQHLTDSSGAIEATLQTWVRSNETRVSQHLDAPLVALQEMLAEIVATNRTTNLYEFVRQVDVKWGEIYDERPYFQKPGQPAHPEDEYTHESVCQKLRELLQTLQGYLEA